MDLSLMLHPRGFDAAQMPKKLKTQVIIDTGFDNAHENICNLCSRLILAIGDGALGFWSALEEEFSTCEQQRCWVHKTANVLDKMAKSTQVHVKKMIHEMYILD